MAVTPQDLIANKLSMTSTVYNGFVDKTPAVQENLANINKEIGQQDAIKTAIKSGLDSKSANPAAAIAKSSGAGGGALSSAIGDVLITAAIGATLGPVAAATYGVFAASKGAVEHLGTQDFTKFGVSGGLYTLDSPSYKDAEGLEWNSTTGAPIIAHKASNTGAESLIQTALNNRFDRKELEQSVSGKTVYEKQLLQMQGAMIAQLRENGDNDMTGLNFEKPKNPAAFSAPKFG